MHGKQTYAQIAQRYGCSTRTIQRTIDRAMPSTSPTQTGKVCVMMDTTYFGRSFGVMLFRDSLNGRDLYWEYVGHETNTTYKRGLNLLAAKGFDIVGVVSDGRKGLAELCLGLPFQICQFHQTAIVTRYLTRKPKSPAGVELRTLALKITAADRDSFDEALREWYSKWKSYLDERTTDPVSGKSWYTHKRLRSAYRSLRTNFPWLFTYIEHNGMPNTTNGIDGHFADLKNKLRNHNGLSMKRKMKFIDEFFKASSVSR